MLLAPYTEGIGNPVDVVEPGCNERDLQDSAVVEPRGAQPFVVLRRDPGRVTGELGNVVEHHAVALIDGRGPVVTPDGVDEVVVQGHPTQKLCV